ncbi:Group XIIA secretory phospholipase A2 [Balamuthia mandrillaris]
MTELASRASSMLCLPVCFLPGLGGGKSTCPFHCAVGTSKQANPNHTPTTNGCGPSGLSVATKDFDFGPCCDAHDLCYDTCGKTKEQCDEGFQECMNTLCASSYGQNQGCKAAGSLFYMGALLMGCESYKTSQKNACLCVPKDEL